MGYILGMEIISPRSLRKGLRYQALRESDPHSSPRKIRRYLSTTSVDYSALIHQLSCYRTLSASNISPMENGESSFSGNPSQYSTLVPPISNMISTTVSGNFNRDAANVSNCNNTTINNNIKVGVYEESWVIQEWLSPLEPRKRHEDVRNSRLDGIGEWVLQRDEFTSWSKGQDGSVNPTFLCYGGPGVGKTYIRYDRRISSNNQRRCLLVIKSVR